MYLFSNELFCSWPYHVDLKGEYSCYRRCWFCALTSDLDTCITTAPVCTSLTARLGPRSVRPARLRLAASQQGALSSLGWNCTNDSRSSSETIWSAYSRYGMKKYNKQTTRVPVVRHKITWAQSSKVMSSLPRVVWWMKTATRVVFYLLWIWKYKIVVNNTFLVPTLTFETTIYIDGLCLEIQNNGRCVRKYHSDVVKHCFN